MGTPRISRIRARREALGLTSTTAAAQAGIDLGLYSRIENGQQMPSVANLIALGRVLNLPDLVALERYWEPEVADV